MISVWAVIVLAFIIMAGMLGSAFLGAWIAFRFKTAGTGMPFVQPGTPKEDATGEPASYMKGLLEDLGEAGVLSEEPLSPAAQRIRDQKMNGGSTMAETMREVMGKS